MLLGRTISLAFQRIDMYNDRMVRALHGRESLNQARHVVTFVHIYIVQSHGPEQIARASAFRLAQFLQVAINAAVVLGDGHLVVVHYNNQIGVQFGSKVQALEGFAATQRAVADNGYDILRPAGQVASLGQPARQTDRRGSVADDKVVVFALGGFGIAGHVIIMRGIKESVLTSRQHLVGIALVRDIKDNLVLGRVEDIVQGYGSLHHAKVRTDMSAVGRKFLQQSGPHLRAKSDKFVSIQAFHVGRRIYSA